MGTSQSSNGSPPGVPMVPPWVPDLPLPGPVLGSADAGEGGPPDNIGNFDPGVCSLDWLE